MRRGAGLGGRDLRGAGGEHGQPNVPPAPTARHAPAGTRVGGLASRGAAACRLLRSLAPFPMWKGVPSRLRPAVLAASDLGDPNRRDCSRRSPAFGSLHALNSLPRAPSLRISAAARHGCSAQHHGYLYSNTARSTRPHAGLLAGAFTKDATGEAKPRPVARKTASRQFSSDSTPSRLSSSGSNSDADLASNVYRSLSLTVSEADDETMASKRGALEVKSFCWRRRSTTRTRTCSRAALLHAAPGGHAAVGGVRLAEEALAECNNNRHAPRRSGRPRSAGSRGASRATRPSATRRRPDCPPRPRTRRPFLLCLRASFQR